jgi:hypothetical protein
MIFANLSKLERAQNVVAHPAKFAAESVEVVALGRVNASGAQLTDEETVIEVYKILGGVLLASKDAEAPVERPKKKSKSDE